MPPRKATKVALKNDLRAFFGSQPKSSQTALVGGASQTPLKPSQPTPKKGSERDVAIEISDGGASLSRTKATSTKSPMKPKPKPAPAAPMDVDQEGPAASQPPTNGVKRKKAAVLVSSDEEEADQRVEPPKKRVANARHSTGAPARAKVAVDDSEGEDVKPVPAKKKTPTKQAKNGTAATRKAKVLVSDSEEEDVKPAPAKKKAPTKRAVVSDSEDEEDVKPKAAAAKKKTPAKRKSAPDNDDYDDVSADDAPKASTSGKKPAPAKKGAPVKVSTSASGSTSNLTDDKPKFNWAAARAAKSAGPAAPGSKPIPEPLTPDCLAGLAFVFTGELSAFSREEAVELAKRFGGRVTGQPSSKTSYVVLGENAGPSKLAAIKKNKLTTLTEDEFLELIGTRVGPGGPGGAPIDAKARAKAEREQAAIRDNAKEMERRERKDVEASGKGKGKVAVGALEGQLWTDRYAPTSLKELCGNKGQVEKLLEWLQNWETNRVGGFKKPGKTGAGVFRAMMITGPPGIGKTTSAHMCARLAGYTPVELNASDARSKKLVEAGTNIQNASLDGWMGGGEATNAAGVKITEKSCLIMDEVDGMSGGDRGGVGAMNALIKKSRIPIICIANDRGAQKLKPLMATTFNLPFRRPEVNTVRSRILSIVYKERMKVPANVIDQLITGSQSDIRQVLNMLSTWKLSSDTMDFDEGKTLSKLNEKYTLMTPFNVISKMFGPYMFSPTTRETLSEKMEYYFHDHQWMGLFVQENYLKGTAAKIRNFAGPAREMMQLQLMDKAAASISDGDLVDSLIHGPEQHWSLMPLHAVCSFVRPASFLYGGMQAYGGPNAIAFPQWLGQNSKQNKLQRQLGDLQIRMRLKVSGDKAEIRQSYLPALFPHVVQPLVDDGVGAVDDVIDFMDEYFLSREDWDTLVELGVDDRRDEAVLKKISTATKSGFTRKYNVKEHPIPFHKASFLGKAPKKLSGAGPAPDLEDAFDLDEEAPPSDDEREAEEEDVSKDKLLKAKTGKGASGSGKAAAKGAAKAKAKK